MILGKLSNNQNKKESLNTSNDYISSPNTMMNSKRRSKADRNNIGSSIGTSSDINNTYINKVINPDSIKNQNENIIQNL